MPSIDVDKLKQAIAGRESAVYAAYGVTVSHNRHTRCPLPSHPDRNPSFRVEASTGQYHCSCGSGDVFAFVQQMDGCGFKTAVQRVAGLYSCKKVMMVPTEPATSNATITTNRTHALKLWREAKPAVNTLADHYARTRGITIPLPASLRFHPTCWHSPTKQSYPTLIAGVQTVDGEIVAVHRIYLTPTGHKADIANNKSTLGAFKGGAVRLGALQPDKALLVGEGIETMLSAMQLTGYAAWAALGSNLKGVEIPASISDVMICADNGTAGHNAAHTLQQRLMQQGKTVQVIAPPSQYSDFNDYLQATHLTTNLTRATHYG